MMKRKEIFQIGNFGRRKCIREAWSVHGRRAARGNKVWRVRSFQPPLSPHLFRPFQLASKDSVRALNHWRALGYEALICLN